MTEPRMVEVDARRRVSLARFGNPEHQYYFVHVNDLGVITLTPAAVVPVTDIQGTGQ